LSVASILVVYFSWRRRPWAIVCGAIVTFILPLLALGLSAFLIAREYGSPFSDIGLFVAIGTSLVAGLLCLPVSAFAVLVVMEHEPETTWFRSLWRPVVCRRPRWLRWFRRTFVGASCLVVLAGATHATVAEIRRRTPLDDAEEKFMGGSWKVVDNTWQVSDRQLHFPWELGVIWTFSRDRRMKEGPVVDGSWQFPEESGLFVENPHVMRWSAPEDPSSHLTKLILAELRDGTVSETYIVEELDKDSIRLKRADLPKSTIRLQRVGRVSFGRE